VNTGGLGVRGQVLKDDLKISRRRPLLPSHDVLCPPA